MEYGGIELKRGSRGAEVAAVQKRLGVQQTAVFGPTTETCVTAFQRSRGLDPDGIVGPLTWGELFRKVDGSDLGLAALAEARKRVGVVECPLGSNRGPQIDLWNIRAGAAVGSFWCLSFAYSMVDEAARKLGRRNPLHRTGSCSALFYYARRYGMLTPAPEPGDLFLCIGGDTGHYHVGFVGGPMKAGRFPTVEGNSNKDGSANGIGVVERARGRHLTSCHYVRL